MVKTGIKKSRASNNNLVFEQRLWHAVDKRRGPMNAAEHKRVTFGLIVLKHVADVFEEKYAKTERPAFTEIDLRGKFVGHKLKIYEGCLDGIAF